MIGRRRILLISCCGAFALLASGCALLPKLGPAPPVGPPYIPPPEPVWVMLDPALYQAAADSAQSPTRRTAAGARSRSRASGPSENPLDASGGELPLFPDRIGPGRTASAAESIPTPQPALSIDLPSADRRQLSDAARRNLSAADSLARGADRRPLTARDRAKLENARGLLRQAEEALRRGDLRAAANLAYKARLLAAEVGR